MSAGLGFPAGFLWGTASAAHQVEGDNRNCDWWEFEQKPGTIAGGDTSAVACDHYHRYREDFKLLRELNQNAHRLSIEWSRIEPSEGEFDSRQIRHYRELKHDVCDGLSLAWAEDGTLVIEERYSEGRLVGP